MFILAKNIRTIRKELKCTQGAMADILKVGFRTYVRYETGERDAPVGVLVKVACLGNVSLERLLKEEMSPNLIAPLREESGKNRALEIQSCDLKKGTIRFKKPAVTSLTTLNKSEVKLLTLYRKMPESIRADFEKNMAGQYRASRINGRVNDPLNKKIRKEQKAYAKLLEEAGALKPDPDFQTGKPGRKKLDRKSLREKVSKLKLVAQYPRKLTVS